MILYFADRRFNILEQASTKLPEGITIKDDLKKEDIESGVSSFECYVPFTSDIRERVQNCTKVGNFILRSHNGVNEFFTIMETEVNVKEGEVYVYAEDAGLDLLNEIVGGYAATEAKPIKHYIEQFAVDSGFVVGKNEIASLTRKLSWDGEETVTARLASVATQFDAEIDYSFEVKGLKVVKKLINVYKERGQDVGVQLHLNKEVDNIVTSESVMNVATALRVTGGTPEDAEGAITLDGYKYDDGDFFLDGTYLKTRKGNAVWSRYLAETGNGTGYICKRFEYDTLDKKELLNRAISELKKLREIEVNYEVDITSLPEDVRIGDRVNIVDDAGELYLSTRILVLETSVANQEQKATLGEHLIKNSGISKKVEELAAEFAKEVQKTSHVMAIAKNAQTTAENAQVSADEAAIEAKSALDKANEASEAAGNAQASADNAQQSANNAQTAVENVEKDVEALDATVQNAKTAAENAQIAAELAQTKATEAEESAQVAVAEASNAKTAAENTQSIAESAVTKADEAKVMAGDAVTEAQNAQATASAAKLDAEKAVEDVNALGDRLTSVSNTMEADYARKTDLTETEASLQSQISQNAAQITTTVTKMQEVDETANNAQEQAEAAKTAANAAQAKADQAFSDATNAQNAADAAAQAAETAQSEADAAKQAAETAQSVADTAKTDLEAAKTDLATVKGRVDATEEEIIAAQAAVNAAQTAADNAQAEADTAKTKAEEAQTAASNAATIANNAQASANDAASKATAAQSLANEAAREASAAQTNADEAKEVAQAAQSTANTAKNNAATAQTKADEAAQAAATAQTKADDAEAKANAAQSDLDTAKQNLADVSSRVDATAEEVEAAQAAVVTAQEAADEAKANATTAQNAADKAKTDAATAQTAANDAKRMADQAQADAEAAQAAADQAQADVNALAIRVVDAETSIAQNAEAIELRATKTEVTETLGGYYTKTETDAKIKIEADKISTVTNRVDEQGEKISTMEQNAEGFSIRLETVEADAIVSTVEQFYLSTSATSLSGGSWSNSQPTWTNGKYIWRRTLVTFGDGSTAYTPSSTGVCITGNTGATGAQGATGADGQMLYATCGTAAATAAKVATLSSGTLTLKSGATVSVKFTYANSASSPTLNVSSTGAKTIRLNGAALTSSSYYWVAGAVVTFVYDGTYWNIADGSALSKAASANSTANTAKTNAAAAQSTANTARTEAANAAKTATNYLSFSSSGLVVGDMTASTLGNNVLIDSDSVDIRKGTTVLASYSAKEIDLGKNSTTTAIYLCGRKGKISYADSTEAISIESEKIRLNADEIYLRSGRSEGENAASVQTLTTYEGKALLYFGISYDYTTENVQAGNETWEENYVEASVNGVDICAWENITIDIGSTTGSITLNGAVNVNGKTTINNALTVGGAVTLSGNLSGKYLTGTWLQTTAATDLGSKASKIAVLESDTGWVYYRTPAEILSDIGAAASRHTHTTLTNGSYSLLQASNGNVYSQADTGTCQLGVSSRRWSTIYAVNALNTSSDMRLKKDFSTNLDKYVELLDTIEPMSFVRTIGNDTRRHMGYGAQLVERALYNIGLTKNDFAGLAKEYDEESGDFSYGLAYEEFIPILHAKMNKDKQNAEASIKQLEARIEQLTILSQELLYQLASQQKILKTLAQ